MKILVIRFSSIGDIVLTTPVIRCAKEQLGAEIHFLTKPQFRSLVEPNPHISEVHTFSEDSAREDLDKLKAESFDWIADLHHNLRSLRIKRALKKPGKAFPKLNIEKWLLVNCKIDRLPDKHIVDRYLETVNPLGVVNDGRGLDHFFPDGSEVDLNAHGLEPRQYVCIAIGANHPTKCLEDGQVVSLIGMLNIPVVLLGGPSEETKGEQIAENAGGNVLNMAGQTGIHASAWLVKHAAAVISPDTAMMHFAAAFRTPLVSVWGNTVPEFGMYPYYGDVPGRHTLFEIRGLPCRPCSKIGYDRCPKGHFKCIRDLDMGEIAAATRMFGLGV